MALLGQGADRRTDGGGEVGMKVMRIKITICFPMLDGETKEQAEDRLIERIDPDGEAIMSWNEYDVEVYDDEEG